MLAGVEWSNFELAGAFILGATLATIATIRVVRAVAAMFGSEIRRGQRPAPPGLRGDEEPTQPE